VREVDRIFRDFELTPADCNVVAVSTGPGSFTALRVGVMCAKTFAYASGCRLAAVDTFACIAENSPPDVLRVLVIENAQRSELYVGSFRRETAQDAFVAERPIEIVDGEAWSRERSATDIVSGPGVGPFIDTLGTKCRVLEAELRDSQAATVARLGAAQVRTGQEADFWSLEPFYLRKSSAEEKQDAASNSPE
jgi:tRNA threonylcarbamoyladenosine biosynthesis protein TsaB